jgi:hypothetical protein
MIATSSSIAIASGASSGRYSGRTSDGIPVSVVVSPGGETGTFHYCHVAPMFTISHARFRVHTLQLHASGRFDGNKVTGTIGPDSCAGSVSTFSLRLK